MKQKKKLEGRTVKKSSRKVWKENKIKEMTKM
jgi:hypothetical protein